MTVLGSIRVLIAVEGLAADMLERRLQRETDFELVPRASAPQALAAAQQTTPDFIVVPLADDRRLDAVDLLEAVPRMKVLALELSGGRSFLTELVDDVPPDELIDTLRRAAQRRDV